MRDLHYVYRDPVFQVDVHLRTGSRKKVEKFCNNLNINDYNAAGCWTMEIVKKDGRQSAYLIWLRDKTNYYHLAHEALHLVKMIFKDRGIEFTSDNDEMIAYYQEYWLRRFWGSISRSRKRKVKHAKKSK